MIKEMIKANDDNLKEVYGLDEETIYCINMLQFEIIAYLASILKLVIHENTVITLRSLADMLEIMIENRK